MENSGKDSIELDCFLRELGNPVLAYHASTRVDEDMSKSAFFHV